MSALEINGTSLSYEEHGEGDALIFVHGSASDYRTWNKQKEEFARRYHVIVYSRRYHWPNKHITAGEDYSMSQHVDDLQALIKKLDVAPTHLAGHSYGAFLCLMLAIKKPELVRTLILAEPPVITLFVSNSPRPWELMKILATRPRTAFSIVKFGIKGIAPATAAAKRGDAKKAMRIMGRAILGNQFYNQLSEKRLEQVFDNSIDAEFLGSGYTKLGADQVSEVHIPTLLITGPHSHKLFHRLTDRLQKLLPDVERVEIDDASHIMHEDNAMVYNQAVKLFLEKHRR